MQKIKYYIKVFLIKLKLYERLINYRDYHLKIPNNEMIDSAEPIIIKWSPSLKKPKIALVRETNNRLSYFIKFKRMLEINEFEFDEINILQSNFHDILKNYDVVIWRVNSDFYSLYTGKDIIYFLNNILRIHTLPNFESLWFYENKIAQYWLLKKHDFPVISTFASFDMQETINYINKSNYPIVSKLNTASASLGVSLIKSKKQALKIVKKVFSTGLKTKYTNLYQKDYVLFQEKVPNMGFDLRVVIVGNSYFGYYRYPKKKDFRASGSGITVKEDIPIDILHLSMKIKDTFPKSYMLAIDYLQDTRDNKYYIIETSIFIKIETCEQLMVNGVPGRYIYQDNDFKFQEGRYWLQDLMLEAFFNDYIKKMEGE